MSLNYLRIIFEISILKSTCSRIETFAPVNYLLLNNTFFFNNYSCEDAEAFEVQDGQKSTGIFTKYLNMHILQSEKVTHVLEKVSEGKNRNA